jgi:hypothetical protein
VIMWVLGAMPQKGYYLWALIVNAEKFWNI